MAVNDQLSSIHGDYAQFDVQVLDDLVERLPEMFDMEDIRGRVDEFSPYIMVAIQVCSPKLGPPFRARTG